ncbi:MAG: hypothetical protein DWQ37_10285 [Planctomycetota bacterium]|nr:MAG: hypothetical protein DWQ37_10285 [Planctomycetota bacterium]
MSSEAVRAKPAEFRRRLNVETNGVVQKLSKVIETWQAKDFAALDGGLQVAAGVAPTSEVIQRAYLERARGHSKTTDIAINLAYVLNAATAAITAICVAADADQARLVLDALALLCRINPPLGKVLEIQKNAVINRKTGAKVTVLSSDAPSSWGLLPDFIVCDELTHWQQGEALFESLLSSAAKRAKCMMVIISNAGLGMGTSWQWKIREAAAESPRWYFSRLDGPVASWISEEILDEQRKLMTTTGFNRVWLNQWQAQSGDALEMADVMACVDRQLDVMNGDEEGFVFEAGLDIGAKHDHSALVVVGTHTADSYMQLASCQSWAPPRPGAEVDLEQVKLAVLEAQWRYGLLNVLYDPSQARLMAQQLRRENVNMVEVPFTAKWTDRMAHVILQAFRNRQIRLYHEPALLADLSRLSIEQRSYGYKLVAPSDAAHGHADRAIALALALLSGEMSISEYVEPEPPLPSSIFDLVGGEPHF